MTNYRQVLNGLIAHPRNEIWGEVEWSLLKGS